MQQIFIPAVPDFEASHFHWDVMLADPDTHSEREVALMEEMALHGEIYPAMIREEADTVVAETDLGSPESRIGVVFMRADVTDMHGNLDLRRIARSVAALVQEMLK